VIKVFKFGGASVKDAKGVKNIASVLLATKEKNLVVVVSAMGKMTNSLEGVVAQYFTDSATIEMAISEVYDFHHRILKDLFSTATHSIFTQINKLFNELRHFLKTTKSKNHAFVYDQVVGYGELASTAIISAYLSDVNINNVLLDVRSCVKTDANHRDANVDWQATHKQINKLVKPKGITITQGFLGAEGINNFTTTLGREGSDYTAAILGYCLNAESVTIWKDVQGVLNADPRYFSNTTLLNHISYREAIELAFYGASVIHPKTLQPLQRKEIPLFVKSFLNPLEAGTRVGKGVTLDPSISCFILKKDQVLISLASLDFSFMMEDTISDVFKQLHRFKMRVELIQNSAISFTVCVDNKFDTLEPLLAKLREKFNVKWNEGVTLYTVRHSKPSEIEALINNKEVLIKQESRDTVQLVIKE
jgi:aspartate kinase